VNDDADWSSTQRRLMRRATLVFPMSGRLGNQIFQYSAMRAFMGAEQRLILLDFADLARTFTGIRAESWSSSRTIDRVRLSAIHRARHLIRSPLGRIVQDPKDHRPVWSEPGSVATVRGYFQRDLETHAEHAGALDFRASIATQADEFLREHRVPAASGPLASVHIRRGDYLTSSVGWKGDRFSWVDGGQPVALSADWYRTQMDELRDRLPGVRFLLVGDDPAWSVQELSGPDTLVSHCAPEVDLALLARCDAGVLSPSSFAWWGAWFARNRAADPAAGPFLAPLHWLGYAVGEWWPARVETASLEYRQVV